LLYCSPFHDIALHGRERRDQLVLQRVADADAIERNVEVSSAPSARTLKFEALVREHDDDQLVHRSFEFSPVRRRIADS